MLLCSVSASFAQERQVSAGVVYANSPGTGNRPGVGVRADVVIPIDDLFTLLGETNWVIEPKGYVGDGSAWRARLDGRMHLYPREADLSPFVSVGLSAVHQTTSQYSKGALTWTFSAGAVVQQRYVPYWKRYFPEGQTQNKVSADEIGGELYLPLNDTRWRIRAGVAGVNTRFTQIGGPFAGKHSSWALQTHFGISRVF